MVSYRENEKLIYPVFRPFNYIISTFKTIILVCDIILKKELHMYKMKRQSFKK